MSIGIFARNIKRISRNISLGKSIDRKDQSGLRWKNMFRIALGQSKMVSRYQDNNPLKIVEVEMSKKRFIPGDDEPSSYINFYIANSAIILPFFGDDVADQNAMKIIKEQFPNRQIECLNGHDILMGGGNIHCITQQQPKAIS